MTALRTDSNLQDPDRFYAELLAAHDGLTAQESAAFNARLLFVLANQIGDAGVLTEALEAASQTTESEA